MAIENYSGTLEISFKSKYLEILLFVLIFTLIFSNDLLSPLVYMSILIPISTALFLLEKSSVDTLLDERKSKILLVGLVSAAFIIRIHNLGTPSLWYDEAISANAAVGLLKHGMPVFPSGKTYMRAFPHTVLISASILLIGVSDSAVRFPSVVLGTLTVPLTYLAGRDFFDRDIGVIAAALIAFSTWEIVWSRQARMYSLLQLLYLFSVLMIYRIEKDTDFWRATVLGTGILLSALTHVTAYILPVILISYFAISKYMEGSFEDLYLPAGITAVLLGIIELSYFSYLNLIKRMTFTTRNTFKYLSWIQSEAPALLSLGFLGACLCFKNNRKSSILTILATVPVIYVYSFHYGKPASRYLYVIIPFMAIWSAVAIKRIARTLELGRRNELKIITGVTVLVLFAGNFAAGEYDPGLGAPKVDFKSAYSYVENHKNRRDVIISGWTPPAVYYLEKPPDYALVGEVVSRKERSYKGVEQYSGAKMITSSEELARVIENNRRGWLVLDNRALRGQNIAVRKLIQKLDKEARFGEIAVWSWNRSTFNGN
ncbi:MAG: ArnT family glycosyltransferase [Candidatus Nanosalina sp.]